MFTGIVQPGSISDIDHDAKTQCLNVLITAPGFADTLGQSIAVNGICLTVTAFSDSDFSVTLSPETLQVTNASSWRKGDHVNLERALRIGDRLDGHLVSGHVDGLAELTAIIPHGKNHQWTLAMPDALTHYIARKGSVTLDGVSLTVNEVEQKHFSIMLIPHTLSQTSFANKQVGEHLNLEVDMMARYAERLLSGLQASHARVSHE